MKTMRPFYILTFSIAFALTLPILIQDGMFTDANLYTSVANNLAKGLGSFWFPLFDEKNIADLPSFHEQPPLVFWILSKFYSLLGSSMYVERFYTLLTLLMNALLIHGIWTKIQPHRKTYSWLPILFWITIPVCFWSYANCMHENTMSIFCLASIYLFLHGVKRNSLSIPFLLLSGIAIAGAFLCKGLPGLYPLVIPFLYFLIYKQKLGTLVVQTCWVFIPVALLAAWIWFEPHAHKSIITYYMGTRLFDRVDHWHTVTNRWATLIRLISELLPLLLLSFVSLIISKRTKGISGLKWSKETFLFLALGLAGTLPLMLTSVQKGFYMVAALPCFGLAFASLLVEAIPSWIPNESLRFQRTLRILSMVSIVVAISLTAFQFGKTSRHHDILRDVYAVRASIPEGQYAEVYEKNRFDDWDMQHYLMRYNGIGLRWKVAPFLITYKETLLPDSLGWKRIPIETRKYNFYRQQR